MNTVSMVFAMLHRHVATWKRPKWKDLNLGFSAKLLHRDSQGPQKAWQGWLEQNVSRRLVKLGTLVGQKKMTQHSCQKAQLVSVWYQFGMVQGFNVATVQSIYFLMVHWCDNKMDSMWFGGNIKPWNKETNKQVNSQRLFLLLCLFLNL